jgi:polyisoprenoid-binding protein YceI
MSSVRGRFDDFSGTVRIAQPVEQSSVTAVIQAASVDTANKMRDDHLRSQDFLDVERHPVITYTSTGLTQLSEERWALDGELTLNGVTRKVQLDLTYLGTGPDAWGGTRAAFHAVTELHRDDFAITYNQVLRAGIGAIGATLRVELEIQAVQGETLPGV